MTYDPNDPNRPFEYPSLEGYSGPPANPYQPQQPVDYPHTYPSGAPPGYPQFPPPYQGYGSQPYGAQPYGAPGYNPYDPYGVQPPGTSGMAIGALVSSLLGVTLCFCFIPSIVGIALGVVAMNQTKRTGEKGHGMALAAVIVGAITILLGITFYVIGAVTSDDTSSSY